MKKQIIFGFLLGIFTLAIISAGGVSLNKNSEVTDIMVHSMQLKAASASADTLLISSEPFSIDCDTLSIVFELIEADSMWEGSTSVTFSTDPLVTKPKPADSVYAVIKMQEMSPSNLVNDTATFTHMNTVLTKTYTGGRMYMSAKITPTSTSAGKAKLWIKIHQAYNTVQKIKFKIWSIRKWLK